MAFTSSRVAALTGVSLRELNYWTARNVARPSLGPGHAAGSSRATQHRWTFIDLAAVALVRELRLAGVELEIAGFLARQLQHPSFKPAGQAAVIADGQAFLLSIEDDAAVGELIRSTNLLLLVRLEPIVTALLERIADRPLAVASTSSPAPVPPGTTDGEVDGAAGSPHLRTGATCPAPAEGQRGPDAGVNDVNPSKDTDPVALRST